MYYLKNAASRFFHTSSKYFYAAEKSSLSTLRKKTGYTFANCKKALELHNNDLTAVRTYSNFEHFTSILILCLQAEKWLREQAQTLGWSKATKLEGRITKQGLVGICISNNIGAMIEVNCETDFVARNKTFQQFVASATEACVTHVAKMPTNDVLSKVDLFF